VHQSSSQSSRFGILVADKMRSRANMRAAMLLLGVGFSECALSHSRVLVLRGGGASTTFTAPSVRQDEAPPAGVSLKVVASGAPTDGSAPRIELGSAAYGALGLKPGDRVRVRKMTKAALWSSVADQTVGSAVEDTELEAGSVRVLTKEVAELRLKLGEELMVAPVRAPPVQAGDGAAAAAAPDERVVHRRSFLQDYLWYRMIFGGFGGHHHHAGYHQRKFQVRPYSGGMRRRSRVGGRRR
jgi:hypothetical protein